MSEGCAPLLAVKDFSNEFQLTTLMKRKAECQSKPKSIRPTYHPRTDLQDKVCPNGLQDRSPCKSVLPQNSRTLTEAIPAGFQACKAEQVCCGGTATQPCSEECRAILFFGEASEWPRKRFRQGFRPARQNRFAPEGRPHCSGVRDAVQSCFFRETA